MTDALRLELLGGFHIAIGTTPLSGFTYSKGKALLAYLAVTGQPCGRETLAALLWSDLPVSADTAVTDPTNAFQIQVPASWQLTAPAAFANSPFLIICGTTNPNGSFAVLTS